MYHALIAVLCSGMLLKEQLLLLPSTVLVVHGHVVLLLRLLRLYIVLHCLICKLLLHIRLLIEFLLATLRVFVDALAASATCILDRFGRLLGGPGLLLEHGQLFLLVVCVPAQLLL